MGRKNNRAGGESRRQSFYEGISSPPDNWFPEKDPYASTNPRAKNELHYTKRPDGGVENVHKSIDEYNQDCRDCQRLVQQGRHPKVNP